ncbi:DUF4222 domain-containing protein [Escherichia coli]|nr:DUF4222 domain-containing protein [Escherichia coli]
MLFTSFSGSLVSRISGAVQLYVHVIRWEPETQRVIYLRKDYPHECFSPLWKFRRDFVECEGPPAH